MKTVFLFLSLCIASITYSQDEYFTGHIYDLETEGGGCAIALVDGTSIEFSYDDDGVEAYQAPSDLIVFYNEGLNCKINPKYSHTKFYILTKKTSFFRYDDEAEIDIETEVYLLVALVPIK